MTGPIPTGQNDRPWYYLALRHLRMASRLLRAEFADGAVFHIYHAYECVLSALIAAKGYPVPPDGWTKLKLPSGKTVHAYPSPQGGIQDHSAHKARIVFFDQVADRTKPYYTSHSRLRTFLTFQDRLDALYYNAARNHLPQQRYQPSFATGLLSAVWEFAQEVRNDDDMP